MLYMVDAEKLRYMINQATLRRRWLIREGADAEKELARINDSPDKERVLEIVRDIEVTNVHDVYELQKKIWDLSYTDHFRVNHESRTSRTLRATRAATGFLNEQKGRTVPFEREAAAMAARYELQLDAEIKNKIHGTDFSIGVEGAIKYILEPNKYHEIVKLPTYCIDYCPLYLCFKITVSHLTSLRMGDKLAHLTAQLSELEEFIAKLKLAKDSKMDGVMMSESDLGIMKKYDIATSANGAPHDKPIMAHSVLPLS